MEADHLSKQIQHFNHLHEIALQRGTSGNWGDEEKEIIKTNFTYHSNKIEGLTLTYGETIRFLKDNIIRPGMKLKDVYDLKNHKEVLDQIFNSFEETKLSEETIKKLHGELMKDDAQWEVQDVYLAPAGQYKTDNNYTFRPGGKSHMYLAHELVPVAVRKLVADTNRRLEEANDEGNVFDVSINAHPLTVIAQFHYDLLEIHPFSDGNGRLARLITTLLLLKNKLPIIIIEEHERASYFDALIASESDSMRSAIVTFFVNKAVEAVTRRLNSL